MKNPIKIFLFLIYFFSSNNAFCFNYKSIHEFEIFQNNKKIGFHKLFFQNIEDRIVVNTEIQTTIKLIGVIPFFKYSHKGKEIWINNNFDEAKTSTEKNRKKFKLIAKRKGSKIEIKSRKKVFLINGDSLFTSYWNQNWLKKKVLFDIQHGKKRFISVEKKDFEAIKTSNGTIFAQKYKVKGKQNKPDGKKIDYEIWYDNKGRWVKTKFFIKNSLVEYFLVTKY
jgi:hypothetical protein